LKQHKIDSPLNVAAVMEGGDQVFEFGWVKLCSSSFSSQRGGIHLNFELVCEPQWRLSQEQVGY